MRVPAFGLSKAKVPPPKLEDPHAWGLVVGILLRLRQARWERCNAEVVQAVFV
jgi:hypothetical protein